MLTNIAITSVYKHSLNVSEKSRHVHSLMLTSFQSITHVELLFINIFITCVFKHFSKCISEKLPYPFPAITLFSKQLVQNTHITTVNIDVFKYFSKCITEWQTHPFIWKKQKQCWRSYITQIKYSLESYDNQDTALLVWEIYRSIAQI